MKKILFRIALAMKILVPIVLGVKIDAHACENKEITSLSSEAVDEYNEENLQTVFGAADMIVSYNI
ncbi:MAG: hypothetical protein K6B68_04640 [Eubacterium sp.]|nr:hypothetical protein [Eubacterium sp.]